MRISRTRRGGLTLALGPLAGLRPRDQRGALLLEADLGSPRTCRSPGCAWRGRRTDRWNRSHRHALAVRSEDLRHANLFPQKTHPQSHGVITPSCVGSATTYLPPGRLSRRRRYGHFARLPGRPLRPLRRLRGRPPRPCGGGMNIHSVSLSSARGRGKGQSVSMRIRSSGTRRTASRSGPAVLNVTIPEKDT